ncbi:unnamed protein product [Clavelina lepadiformis]|uniref:Uncharacterized protein n=1 Tax=Clavelina lepadiformis TaxID=159417 RepID=A0ABP0FV81_CLALP
MANVTPEMQLLCKEREKVSFSVEELTNILDGNKEETAIRRKVGNLFLETKTRPPAAGDKDLLETIVM